ncbi:MAG: hypothetical protein GF331_00685 [Chitinivibrionales bacterium]|nr:hypothetical protein [Chitinivibrionales bacterium]
MLAARSVRALVGCCVLMFVLVGCGGIEFPFLKPTPSDVRVEGAAEKLIIGIVDQRTGNDSSYHAGRFSEIELEIEDSDEEWNEVAMLAEALGKELSSRGVPATCVVGKQDANVTLNVKRFQAINLRFTAFDPWRAFHVFLGELVTPDGTRRIPAYFYNGELPGWSMAECGMPCYSMPFSILVKDIAAKVNAATLGLKASDGEVERIVAAVEAHEYDDGAEDEEKATWKILALGATNNPKAVDKLKALADHEDQFLRACALAGLGMLASHDDGTFFAFLKQRYDKYTDIDKLMALKSIGDLPSEQADAFMQTVAADEEAMGDFGVMNYFDNIYNVK